MSKLQVAYEPQTPQKVKRKPEKVRERRRGGELHTALSLFSNHLETLDRREKEAG